MQGFGKRTVIPRLDEAGKSLTPGPGKEKYRYRPWKEKNQPDSYSCSAKHCILSFLHCAASGHLPDERSAQSRFGTTPDRAICFFLEGTCKSMLEEQFHATLNNLQQSMKVYLARRVIRSCI